MSHGISGLTLSCRNTAVVFKIILKRDYKPNVNSLNVICDLTICSAFKKH